MRAFKPLAVAAVLLICLTSAVVISTPVIDLSLVERVPAFLPAASSAVTHYYAKNGSSLATVKAADIASADLVPDATLVGDQIITVAIETAAKITEVVCTNAGPYACVFIALVAVFAIFYTVYKQSGRRDLEYLQIGRAHV